MKKLPLLLLALLLASAQARPRFLITQIVYTQAAAIYPSAINNQGQVTGDMILIPLDYFPFFYSGGQTVQIPTGTQAVGLAINNYGVVAGGYTEVFGSFIWPGGTGPFGPANSFACGINDFGTVAGGSPAYVYQAGVLIDLGLGPSSSANAINNLEQVVASDGFGGSYLWRNGTLKTLPPGISGKINNKGHILGTVQDATGTLIPVVWDEKDGVLVKIRLPAGTTNFGLYALNDKDDVVGVVDLGPFLWNGRFWLLNKLIPGEWVLQDARGINNKGQIIGSGTLNGVRAAYILTPQ